MRKVVFILSVAGLIGGGVVAYVGARIPEALPPAFNPAANPYKDGIYATGILESTQASGQNINVYPEVSGTVAQILVKEGQKVQKGTLLLQIDDSIQRATVEQLQSQALASLSVLDGLRAQPRKENLDVSESQVVAAQAALKTAQDSYAKQKAAFDLNPRAIGKDALDSAANAVATASPANCSASGRTCPLPPANPVSKYLRRPAARAALVEQPLSDRANAPLSTW